MTIKPKQSDLINYTNYFKGDYSKGPSRLASILDNQDQFELLLDNDAGFDSILYSLDAQSFDMCEIIRESDKQSQIASKYFVKYSVSDLNELLNSNVAPESLKMNLTLCDPSFLTNETLLKAFLSSESTKEFLSKNERYYQYLGKSLTPTMISKLRSTVGDVYFTDMMVGNGGYNTVYGEELSETIIKRLTTLTPSKKVAQSFIGVKFKVYNAELEIECCIVGTYNSFVSEDETAPLFTVAAHISTVSKTTSINYKNGSLYGYLSELQLTGELKNNDIITVYISYVQPIPNSNTNTAYMYSKLYAPGYEFNEEYMMPELQNFLVDCVGSSGKVWTRDGSNYNEKLARSRHGGGYYIIENPNTSYHVFFLFNL